MAFAWIFLLTSLLLPTAPKPKTPTPPAVPAGHPRVFVRAADLPDIKAKLTSPEFADAWNQVRAEIDHPKWGPFCRAFIYLTTDDEAVGRSAIEAALADLKKSKDARLPTSS